MRVIVVTPPSPVVTLEEAAEHLRVRSNDEDALIDGMIAAATGHIDGPAGWLGRAIGVQVLEARFDHFDCGAIRLPYPPLIGVESVRYLDQGGALQTVDADDYELMGAALETAHGAAWPLPLARREAVRIQYRAGYPLVPAPIRAAILLMLGDLYAQRETIVTGTISSAVPMSTKVEALLAPYRVWA